MLPGSLFTFRPSIRTQSEKQLVLRHVLEANLKVLVIGDSPRCYWFLDEMRVVGFCCWLRTVGGLETYVDCWCCTGVVSVLFFLLLFLSFSFLRMFSVPFCFFISWPFLHVSSCLVPSSTILSFVSSLLRSYPCLPYSLSLFSFPILFFISFSL